MWNYWRMPDAEPEKERCAPAGERPNNRYNACCDDRRERCCCGVRPEPSDPKLAIGYVTQ